MSAIVLPRASILQQDSQNKAYPFEAPRYGSGMSGEGWKIINGRRRWVNEQPFQARKEITAAQMFSKPYARMIHKKQYKPPTAQEAQLANAKLTSPGGEGLRKQKPRRKHK